MKIRNILLAILISLISVIIIIEIFEKKEKENEKINYKIKNMEKEIKNKEEIIENLIREICSKNIQEIDNSIKKIKIEKGIIEKKGFFLKNNKVLFFDPEKINFEIYLSEIEIKKRQMTEIADLRYSIIICLEGQIITYDTYKKNPYLTILESKRIFCYKISDYTLYLKDPLEKDGKWEPVKIKYIKELKPDPNREHAQYPCMLVYLETKWFKGEYEIMCE